MIFLKTFFSKVFSVLMIIVSARFLNALTGVDRLTHKAHLVDMTGQSYIIKETKGWMKTMTILTKSESKFSSTLIFFVL